MVPAQKKVARSGARNKRREKMPRRKLIRNRPIKRKGQSVGQQAKRCRHNYNLRSSSVEFVSETPCCLNEDTCKKYARLALDSALFHCRSRPVRRRQSHISIVTISSCDDEESMARTAEWVASVEIENKNIPCPEESFNINLDPSHSQNIAGGEVQEIRQQFSLMNITQTGSKIFECSTSSASTSGKCPRSTCPQSVEVSPFGICTSEEYQISGVTDSVMSGLFHPRSSEIYQRPTIQGHRECLPLSAKISEIALNSKNAGNTFRFSPTLPSTQIVGRPFSFVTPSKNSTTIDSDEHRPFSPFCTKISEIALNSKNAGNTFRFSPTLPSTQIVGRPFSFVTPSKNSTTIDSDEHRPFSSFCTITTESHPITTPLGSEVKRQFSFNTTTKEQVSQGYRPLCSSKPESCQNISRLGIEKPTTFCNITLEKKQESKLISPLGNRISLFNKLEPMEVQNSPEVVLETPSTAMPSSIFQTPFNSSLNTVNTPRNSLSITDPSIQKENNELETENKKQFYFGTLKTHEPFEHLFPSQVEENRSAQENNSISSYECSISGIERISNGNPESPQRSISQESSIQRLESSSNANDGSII